jgi:nicotinate-nucleotide adenylyltransferase
LTFVRLPPHAPGLRIGLFGGSFNPPHEGHRAASLLALRRLRLDRIWWLVSPGNPLKDRSDLAELSQRLAAARKVARHPKIVVTGFEASLGSAYTFETLRYAKSRCAGVHFVWLMGADNLLGFHHWKSWREIADLVPIAVIDRPGATLKATRSRAGQALAPYRKSETEGPRLALTRPPAFIFLHGPRSDLSSTELREIAHTKERCPAATAVFHA